MKLLNNIPTFLIIFICVLTGSYIIFLIYQIKEHTKTKQE